MPTDTLLPYETLAAAAKRGFVRGVTFDEKTGCWRARLSVRGVRVDIGRNLPSARDAIDAIRATARSRNLEVDDVDLFVLLKTNGEPKSTPLGFRGITWHKRSRKWCARRSEDGVQRYVGLFDTLPEAIDALHRG